MPDSRIQANTAKPEITLREFFQSLSDERLAQVRARLDELHHRIDTSDKHCSNEILHLKELTKVAADASSKAVDKAEAAQREYNAHTNEFRGQLQDQATLFIQRTEVQSRFDALSDKFDARLTGMVSKNEATEKGLEAMIEALRREVVSVQKWQSENKGKEFSEVRRSGDFQWGVGIWVVLGTSLLGLLVTLASTFMRLTGH